MRFQKRRSTTRMKFSQGKRMKEWLVGFMPLAYTLGGLKRILNVYVRQENGYPTSPLSSACRCVEAWVTIFCVKPSFVELKDVKMSFPQWKIYSRAKLWVLLSAKRQLPINWHFRETYISFFGLLHIAKVEKVFVNWNCSATFSVFSLFLQKCLTYW